MDHQSQKCNWNLQEWFRERQVETLLEWAASEKKVIALEREVYLTQVESQSVSASKQLRSNVPAATNAAPQQTADVASSTEVQHQTFVAAEVQTESQSEFVTRSTDKETSEILPKHANLPTSASGKHAATVSTDALRQLKTRCLEALRLYPQ